MRKSTSSVAEIGCSRRQLPRHVIPSPDIRFDGEYTDDILTTGSTVDIPGNSGTSWEHPTVI